MARQNVQLIAFNRGRLSNLGLGRIDLSRTLLSAEMQTNWIPRTLGSMMLRPGLGYIGTIRNSSTARVLPFVFSATDAGILELTSTALRVWQNDSVIGRLGTTRVVTNSDFSSSALTGWTDDDETGSTSAWATGNYLTLAGTRYARAKRSQSVTVTTGTTAVTLGLAVKIQSGHVFLRVGSSARGDDIIAETELRAGHHSFSVTSTNVLAIQLGANTEYRSYVKSVELESSGDMVIDTTWAGTSLGKIRYDQSADVVFVANSTYAPKKIIRYGQQSWGVAEYFPEDGPYRTINTSIKRLTPSGRTGEITLAADSQLFSTDHVGSLFRITSIGQDVSVTLTAADQWSEAIRVSGVDAARNFQILVTSSTSWAATVRIQKSFGEEGNWVNDASLVYTSTIDSTYDDNYDNQIVFYRIGVASTFTSGSLVGRLIYVGGGLVGVARITAVAASTSASANVVDSLGSTNATELWEEGDWSDKRGWPSAVTLHEGRLWWAGKAKVWGSVSDAYESFDPDTEGDSGPLNRTIATGGVDKIQWVASLGRLIIGSESGELQAKTGSLEEPLTPTNFNLRDVSNQGSASVQAVKLDKGAIFVQRSGTRVMQTLFSEQSFDYETGDRTALVPEIGEPSIVRTAIQRQPDTRIHCVRSATDGTVGMLISDKNENVSAWIDINSTGANGAIEDVVVLPGANEDSVYYVVRREVNGSTVRYLEKWAQESQARGGSSNRLADSHVVYSGTATTIIPTTHLVGSSVIAWGATADLGSYTVSSTGSITLSQSATYACVGLPYEAWYKSVKLAYGVEQGTALLQTKRVSHLGLLMANVHAQGIEYGRSTNSTDLDSLPLVKQGSTISTDVVNATFDERAVEFNGLWNTDSRIVLKATAPRPVTVLGAVIEIETKESK